ncbi:MAG: TonB-dependent receptor plug domain-containing protein [Gemmatimonadetes bacterium]|nr:TonB-dependent receptor plug domain-containing protein [Gemmatimonadota bacterium]
MNEVARSQIETAARSGMRLGELVRTMPGAMTTGGNTGAICVMYRAIRTGGGTGCREVSVILDGVPVGNPSYLYNAMSLSDIERLEMLSPGEAGVQYGMRAGQAVLLIETRQGTAAVRSDASRFVTGFDRVVEGQTYPWLGVLSSTAAVNAVGVGIGLVVARRCLSTPMVGSLGLRTSCNGLETAGTGVLTVVIPALVNSLVARRMGSTERTRSRIMPTALSGGIALASGYLLLVHGGDRAMAAGIGILSFGVPVTVALIDRALRVLR